MGGALPLPQPEGLYFNVPYILGTCLRFHWKKSEPTAVTNKNGTNLESPNGSSPVVLKLECASESSGGLDKTQMAGPLPRLANSLLLIFRFSVFVFF